MKPQVLVDNLSVDEIKAEILKVTNWLIGKFLAPYLAVIILAVVKAILKKFNVSPKFETRLMADPDPGTTPPAP